MAAVVVASTRLRTDSVLAHVAAFIADEMMSGAIEILKGLQTQVVTADEMVVQAAAGARL